MGGKSAKITGGRIWRSINKVVDPLNIMDPVGVLPSSWIAGKKPFQYDKNYGKLQWNLGGNDQGLGNNKSQYDPTMMMYLSQMQSQQAAQAKAAQDAQKQALLTSQQKQAESLSQQGELEAQKSLAQAGEMQKVKDIAALTPQQKSQQIAATSLIGDEFNVGQPQQQVATNQNLYNLPRTSTLKFGGT